MALNEEDKAAMDKAARQLIELQKQQAEWKKAEQARLAAEKAANQEK